MTGQKFERSPLLAALAQEAKTQQREAEAAWQTANDPAAPGHDPAFRPLDDAEQAQLLDQFLPAAQVVPISKKRWWAASAGLLAAAAALTLWLQDPSVPEYSMNILSGTQQVRGESIFVAEYTYGSRLELSLAPQNRPQGNVEMSVFVTRPDGTTQKWTQWERGEAGGFRIKTTVSSAWAPAPGSYRWVIWIGPRSLPEDKNPGSAFQRFEYLFRVRPEEELP